MPKFAANLSMLFTEIDFLDRFQAAANAGFKGVVAQFKTRRDFGPEIIADHPVKQHVPVVADNIDYLRKLPADAPLVEKGNGIYTPDNT